MAILSGWFISYSSIERTSDKHRKLAAVYLFVVTMVSAALLLVAVFATTLSFTADLVSNPIGDATRGEIACYLDGPDDGGGGCSACGRTTNRCPEWTVGDVTTIYKSQAFSLAVIAAIFFAYAFGAARFGFHMRRHLNSYQIEYV